MLGNPCRAIDVIDVLSDLFILRGIPAHIRSDNGPEFVAKAVQEWIAYIERGSQWENGFIESFNARLLDERRDFLHFTRSPDRHRELAAPLQHDQASRLNRIQATSTGGVRARIRRVVGCATPTGSAGYAGATADLKLTFHLDHSAGADHRALSRVRSLQVVHGQWTVWTRARSVVPLGGMRKRRRNCAD